MPQIQQEIEIQCTADSAFAAPSSAYAGTTEISTTLTPAAASVHVGRVVILGIRWPMRLVQPLVVRQFRRESERRLVALKAFAEGNA